LTPAPPRPVLCSPARRSSALARGRLLAALADVVGDGLGGAAALHAALRVHVRLLEIAEVADPRPPGEVLGDAERALHLDDLEREAGAGGAAVRAHGEAAAVEPADERLLLRSRVAGLV